MFNFLFEFIRIQNTEYVSSQIRYMYKFKGKPRDSKYCSGILVLTVLSKPRVISIKKKMMDQNTEPSSVAMTSGYTTNTSPGP